MGQSKGNMRAVVIAKMLDTYLFAYVNKDYEAAGNVLKQVTPMLGVTIPRLPLDPIIYPSDEGIWKNYCSKNAFVVMQAWSDLLKKLGEAKNPFKFSDKPSPKKPDFEPEKFGFDDDEDDEK